MGKFKFFDLTLLSLLFLSATFVSVSAFTTGSYGSSSYGSCASGQACSISVTSDGGLSISLTPTSSGDCSTNYDSVSVLTDDANGYSLSISNNSATTNSLVSGSNSISSTSGTASSPAALSINQWGYRVDTVSSGGFSTPSSFGAGPTSQVTNVNYPISPLFAQTKLSGSSDIIATDSTSSDPATTTTVWYGTCANTNIASGTYTTTLVYTAIAD